MPSEALSALLEATNEVDVLQRANPSPTGAAPNNATLTSVIGRASVVLLSSHFERYNVSVIEELTEYVNHADVAGTSLPVRLRLMHARSSIEDLARTSWDNRQDKIVEFLNSDAPLWNGHSVRSLSAERILSLSSPMPEQLIKLYRLWDIQDIFAAITRTAHTKHDLFWKLQSLVDKRNAIAHGTVEIQATQADIRQYTEAVKTFCVRVDRLLAGQIGRLCGTVRLW